jgi:small subunit ribosomal protein S17
MEQKRKSVMTGTVVKKSARKTVRVEVERLIRHPLYRKVVRRKKTFLVHDEKEICRVGDVVRIIESRPVSKQKRWRVLDILQQPAAGSEVEAGGKP